MHRFCLTGLLAACLLAAPLPAFAQQQLYRVPDKNSLKHLTTKHSTRGVEGTGQKTVLDYYEAPNGQIITIYSFRGRNVAFSVHSNKDVQGSYRVFVDLRGDGNFQEAPGGQWQVPPWAK